MVDAVVGGFSVAVSLLLTSLVLQEEKSTGAVAANVTLANGFEAFDVLVASAFLVVIVEGWLVWKLKPLVGAVAGEAAKMGFVDGGWVKVKPPNGVEGALVEADILLNGVGALVATGG